MVSTSQRPEVQLATSYLCHGAQILGMTLGGPDSLHLNRSCGLLQMHDLAEDAVGAWADSMEIGTVEHSSRKGA